MKASDIGASCVHFSLNVVSIYRPAHLTFRLTGVPTINNSFSVKPQAPIIVANVWKVALMILFVSSHRLFLNTVFVMSKVVSSTRKSASFDRVAVRLKHWSENNQGCNS